MEVPERQKRKPPFGQIRFCIMFRLFMMEIPAEESSFTVPLAFFPEPFKTIAYYLPFQSIYNTPLSILLNAEPNPQEIITALGVQLAWCIAMMIISKLFWKVSLRQITVNGG